jgi:hypothetical protein
MSVSPGSVSNPDLDQRGAALIIVIMMMNVGGRVQARNSHLSWAEEMTETFSNLLNYFVLVGRRKRREDHCVAGDSGFPERPGRWLRRQQQHAGRRDQHPVG